MDHGYLIQAVTHERGLGLSKPHIQRQRGVWTVFWFGRRKPESARLAEGFIRNHLLR